MHGISKRALLASTAVVMGLLTSITMAIPPIKEAEFEISAPWDNERPYVRTSSGLLIYQKTGLFGRTLYITHHTSGPSDKLRLPGFGWIRINDDYFDMVPIGDGDLKVTVPWNHFIGSFDYELELYDTNDVRYYREHLIWEPN